MAADQRTRLEDYVNDKVQRQADLDNLDDLIEKVKEQQGLFKQQLRQARSDHDASREESSAQSDSLLARVQAFQKTQSEIDKRFLALTRSEVSDGAVIKFRKVMTKLKELEIAEKYIGLLSETERLAADAFKIIEKSPKSALGPYVKLHFAFSRLREARPGTEDAAPHLNDHLEEKVVDLYNKLKNVFSDDLDQVLQKMGWPKQSLKFDKNLEDQWLESIDNLLDLQKPALRSAADESMPMTLLPLEVMIKPLAARFRYHFSGDRPTNRLEKPEYFLSHVIELLNDYDGFFSHHLQPVLQKHFKGTTMALDPVYIDSTSALITAVLPMLREKLASSMQDASKQSQLMSHLMHELMKFDSGLRDDWNYGGSSIGDWKGLAGELLDAGWFLRWLEVEKDFALQRYQNILDSADSGEIDFESMDPGTTKPTKAAIRVNDLLETITDRYRPLTSFQQKVKFVVDIQLAIFDRYYERLNEALEAFVTLSNPIARKVQGYSRDDASATKGMQGMERLCRIYGSAEYLVRKMSDWSNDVFFLELWDELQYRSGGQGSKMETTNISIEDVSSKNADEGALFDEVCSHYEKLRARTDTLLSDQAFESIRDALKPYSRVNSWTITESDINISAELDSTLQTLSQQLTFLDRCLANAPLRKIARSLLQQSQSWLWDHVIVRNHFSTAGVNRLERDLQSFWGAFDTTCGKDFGQAGMRRLDEAIQLMNLPLDGDEVTLAQVEERIFKSNEEARAMLEELGLEVLNETDARLLVQKRIELAS